LSLFCTISTSSHLYKTFALADSLLSYGYKLHVLLVDDEYSVAPRAPENLKIFDLKAITDKTGLALINRYRNAGDKLRWALKPIWLLYSLQSVEKVIYVDNDIYFYSNPSFLFDELNQHTVLLTPHFYPTDPKKNQNWLEANLRVGLFNAGFFAVNRNATEILAWWAECCMYKLTKSTSRGLFDDQKYLDILPVKFDGVKILKHKGCNLAGWNATEYSLVNQPTGLTIEGLTPIIFIHFADLSMRLFSHQTSNLFTYYQSYINALRKYKSDYVYKRNYFSVYQITSFINYLIWKIKRMMD
jgi:hypothetical protein